MTSHAICGATALIWATSNCASLLLLPCWSMVHAAFWHSSRVCSISLRDLAIASRTTPCSESGLPNAIRFCTRSTISASARSAAPIARMQWWMRPGPNRAWAIANPLPSSSSRFDTGTRTLSNTISQWPCWSCQPNTGSERWMSTPGVSTGTRIIDC